MFDGLLLTDVLLKSEFGGVDVFDGLPLTDMLLKSEFDFGRWIRITCKCVIAVGSGVGASDHLLVSIVFFSVVRETPK